MRHRLFKAGLTTMQALYDIIQKEFSISRAFHHVQFLVDEVGERLSGTAQIETAAAYILSRLRECGIEAWMDSFPMYHSFPGKAHLRLLEPETRDMAARPVCHIASTNADGVEGYLVYAGNGNYNDYEGIDVQGKIVLTDMTWNPGRPEKARIAWELGAIGLIIMNWGPSNGKDIQMGAVKSQWGNPTPASFQEIPQLPVLSISRSSGEYLAARCREKDVRVWLQADASREWVTACQPMAMVRAHKDTDAYILVGGHLDAWGKTAICNASGNALCLEMARLFSRHRDKLNRNIVFAFWDGHEIAEGAGSAWYVDTQWDRLKSGCLAYIDIDNIAIKGTAVPGIESHMELKGYLLDLIQKVWHKKGHWTPAGKGAGDSSFFGVGVPHIHFATEFTPEKLKQLNFAFYGPSLHTEKDTIDKIDRELYQRHADFFLALTLDLVFTEVVPYDFTERLRQLHAGLCYLADESEPIYSGKIEPLVRIAEQLIQTYQTVEAIKIRTRKLPPGAERRWAVERLNRGLMEFMREISPIALTVGGKYNQDPCCSVFSGQPVPMLSRPLIMLQRFKPGSHEFLLWETDFFHCRNQMADGLRQALSRLLIFLSDMEEPRRLL